MFAKKIKRELRVEARTIVHLGTYIFVTNWAFETKDASPAEVPSEKKLNMRSAVRSSSEYRGVEEFLKLKTDEKTKFKIVKKSRGFKIAQTYPRTDP
jgi:hypothetical protein